MPEELGKLLSTILLRNHRVNVAFATPFNRQLVSGAGQLNVRVQLRTLFRAR